MKKIFYIGILSLIFIAFNNANANRIINHKSIYVKQKRFNYHQQNNIDNKQEKLNNFQQLPIKTQKIIKRKTLANKRSLRYTSKIHRAIRRNKR